MVPLKTQPASKITIAILIIAFLAPSFVKLVDAFQTHSFENCKTQQTHYHKQTINCDLCKIKFNHAFKFQPQTYTVLNTLDIFHGIDFYKSKFTTLKLEQTSLRGPPQIV
jgi:hypothetical protein